MTYSIDFRKKVLSIKKEQRMSYEKASKFFGISKTSILKWKKNVLPKRGRNKPATRIDMEALKIDIKKYPDSYHYERAQRLGVGTRTVGYALKRLNVTYKKKPNSPESERRRETELSREDI